MPGEQVFRVANCRSCGARIIWVVFNAGLKSAHSAPVNADPDPRKGNTVLFRDPSLPHEPGKPIPIRATVLRTNQAAGARASGDRPLYTSHFASCPQADSWRKGSAARHAKQGGRR